MNSFDDCEQPLSLEDLSEVERHIGHRLPPSFERHYLRYNGGTPRKAFFPGDDEWEPVEVAQFFPFKYKQSDHDHRDALLEGRYAAMVARSVIPAGLLPFANDHGGNFFCLDLNTGAVCFYATDAFDPDIGAAENHARARRDLCRDFGSFIAALTTEDEAYG